MRIGGLCRSVCKVGKCTSRPFARGYCAFHYAALPNSLGSPRPLRHSRVLRRSLVLKAGACVVCGTDVQTKWTCGDEACLREMTRRAAGERRGYRTSKCAVCGDIPHTDRVCRPDLLAVAQSGMIMNT